MGLFFNKTVKLGDTDFFRGFVDFHCHILPGVDDGIRTMEDALTVLSKYEELGIRAVWLTPHIMEDIPNTPAELQQRFEELKAAYSGPVVLHLSAENMMDSLFTERFQKGELLPSFERRLLVETSYFTPPMDLHGILAKVKSVGYFPLLAHPERYIYMDMKEYRKLKEEGVQFQLNIGSLVGYYGSAARSKAERLLSDGYYNFVGTDLHSVDLCHYMREGKVKAKLFPKLQEITK